MDQVSICPVCLGVVGSEKAKGVAHRLAIRIDEMLAQRLSPSEYLEHAPSTREIVAVILNGRDPADE